MEKLLEIIWGFLAIIALIGFFVMMYASVGISYDSAIKMKRENPVLWKLIGSNDKYLDDKDKWIRHCRIYLVLFALLFIAIIIPLIMTFE